MPMQKESKANLIFVIILVATMVPGVTMLVRRKLNGDHTSAALPDPVPYALAYIQPAPTPPGLPRMEPALVRDWVQRLVREKVGIDVSVIRNPGGGPVVSHLYFTQAVALLKSDHAKVLWLLIWSDLPPVPDRDLQLKTADHPPVTLQRQAMISIDLPTDVRHSLQGVGYIDPPQHVWLAAWNLGTAGSAHPPFQFAIENVTSKSGSDQITIP